MFFCLKNMKLHLMSYCLLGGKPFPYAKVAGAREATKKNTKKG